MARLPLSVDSEQEIALLIGIRFRSRRGWDVHDSLDELALLADTAGAKVVDRVICHLVSFHPATFIGKGKAAQIADQAREAHASVVIFDEELSPAQSRNLEDALGVKVIDRTQLILDIFAQHARTQRGRLQIELAQLQYLLPRLRQLWTHLERQKGGIGLRGPGERSSNWTAGASRTASPASAGAGTGPQPPRGTAARPPAARLGAGHAGRLHQRREVHAAEQPDRRRRGGRRPALRHAGPDHAPDSSCRTTSPRC